jgi:aspartyl-tRNA(Asn)/glutamyl-tRNA(Gln) amidotransferase subunit A
VSSLWGLTVLEAAARLEAREVSAVELASASLARIEAIDAQVGAFLRTDAAGALEAARASDARRAAGTALGRLDGVPMALKDNILTRGLESTAGSRMLEGFVPPRDATVAHRLREAGAVLIGKCNCDEFAMGSSTEASAFQKTHNPYDLSRTPGGSSGGSAAAVAAREVPAALGTDTGGSIRQPAALTGTVGLKPTWGRVSRAGVVAYASSLDQVGPLTRTVDDAAALLQVIAGRCADDATSSALPVPHYELRGELKGLRVGLPREYFVDGMDAQVSAAVRDAARQLEAQGASVRAVSLPHTQYALAAYYVIATSEASSNLARYDGVRFGHRTREAHSLTELYLKQPQRGLRPRGEAPHHARHLRAVGRVLRRLLRQGAARAYADHAATSSAPSPRSTC